VEKRYIEKDIRGLWQEAAGALKNLNEEIGYENDCKVDQSISKTREEANMLWTICVILLILWLMGLVSGYTMGGVIHVLLVIAIIVVLVRVIQGRRPL
jgi:hypothetical protein